MLPTTRVDGPGRDSRCLRAVVQAPATGGAFDSLPVVAHHVISHGARATIVKVDEGQFTLDGHADFRDPQKVTWRLF